MQFTTVLGAAALILTASAAPSNTNVTIDNHCKYDVEYTLSELVERHGTIKAGKSFSTGLSNIDGPNPRSLLQLDRNTAGQPVSTFPAIDVAFTKDNQQGLAYNVSLFKSYPFDGTPSLFHPVPPRGPLIPATCTDLKCSSAGCSGNRTCPIGTNLTITLCN